jgi:hypothetical protein
MAMNYEKEIQKIENFLRDEYYREAGRNCGAILESALKGYLSKNKN